jgi:prepilin-type processing-associated H-X9-DG protein
VSQYGIYISNEAQLQYPGGLDRNYIAKNHTDGTNWCFADGHVKWYPLSQVINTANPAQDLLIREKPGG